MSGEEFARADIAVGRELFERAKEVRERQRAMAEAVLEELGITDARVVNLLKRDDFDAFRAGVLEKVRRKKYASLAQMDDMVRGRFDLGDPRDVPRVVEALQRRGFEVTTIEGPRARAGIEEGYPRHHVVLRDPQTGITHEWQIGARATTELYERPGIALGPVRLKEGMAPNLHDIEYDIFKALQESDLATDRRLAEEVGIPGFRREVAAFAAETGRRRIPPAEFDRRLAELHAEASNILAAIVARRGPRYVEKFYH